MTHRVMDIPRLKERMVEFKGRGYKKMKVFFFSNRIIGDYRSRLMREGYHVYSVRHSDTDWTKPVLAEPFVCVNHMGTLITTEKLKMEDAKSIVEEHYHVIRKPLRVAIEALDEVQDSHDFTFYNPRR